MVVKGALAEHVLVGTGRYQELLSIVRHVAGKPLKDAGFTEPIPKVDGPRGRKMNRKQRRAWLREQRRKGKP